MLETDLDELPASERRQPSQFKELLEHVDGKVVALIRGVDFDAEEPQNGVRGRLSDWAKRNGVKVSTSSSYRHHETGKPSPFEKDGEPLPYTTYVKVTTNPGRGRATRRPSK